MWTVLLAAAALSSTEQRPTRVTFETAATCPTQLRFEQELVFRTTRVSLVTDDSATAFIAVSIRREGKRFSGQLTVRTADGKAISKALGGPKCESVTAALSLAAALVLDPEGAKTGVLPETLPPVPVVVPAPVVEAPQPEPVVAPVVLPPPGEPVVVEAPAPVVPGPPSPSELRLVSGIVSALGLLSSTVSGRLDFGGGARGSLEIDLSATSPFHFDASLALGVSSGQTLTALGVGSAGYSTGATGLAHAGLGLSLGAFRPSLTLALQVTTMSVAGVGADQNLTSQRWLAATGPDLTLGVEFAGWRASLSGMLAVTLVREQYRIDPDGLVFAVPPVGVVSSLQIGRVFR